MADIFSFSVRITTTDVANAGTDGDVYLGMCGREFFLDSSSDDFERAADKIYILGAGANILNKDLNNPGNPRIRTEDLDKYPVYVRLEGGSDWNLSMVIVEIGDKPAYYILRRKGMWLGRKAGRICFLKKGSIADEGLGGE